MSDEKELTKLDCGGCPVPRFQHEHDCGFPDCIGGWQNAFKLSANRCEELQQQLTAARERIEALEDRSKFEKIIKGCLSSTIKAHGPITDKYLQSAAKRISGQIIAAFKSKQAR